MGELVICTPLRLEQAAVLAARRRPGTVVRRIGMGPVRTRRAAALLPADGPVAVMGIAGSLRPQVRSGQLVVADELATEDGVRVVPCRSAAPIAAGLRELGFTVHVGRVVSASRIIHGTERDRLGATGAIAVEMESGYLAEQLDPTRPLAVVRAISDSGEEPLLHPSFVRRVGGCLAQLRRAVPVVERWAQSLAVAEEVV